MEMIVTPRGWGHLNGGGQHQPHTQTQAQTHIYTQTHGANPKPVS